MKLIVAIDRNGAIGRGGDQPFYIPEDLRHFKAVTMDKAVVMGRRTFEALPRGPLPRRRNIVVSRRQDYGPEGVEVYGTLQAALSAAGDDAVVIGGAEIYRQALPMADTLELTVIDAVAEGADTFFPPIPLEQYRITAVETVDSTPPCRFITLTKK